MEDTRNMARKQSKLFEKGPTIGSEKGISCCKQLIKIPGNVL